MGDKAEQCSFLELKQLKEFVCVHKFEQVSARSFIFDVTWINTTANVFDKRKELEEWWWSAVCFLVILAICSTQQRELDLFRSSWPFMMHSNVNYSLSMNFTLIARIKHIHDSPADSLASIWCSRRTYYIMSRIALYLNFVEKQLQTIVHRKTIIRRFLWRSIECFSVTHRKWQKNKTLSIVPANFYICSWYSPLCLAWEIICHDFGICSSENCILFVSCAEIIIRIDSSSCLPAQLSSLESSQLMRIRRLSKWAFKADLSLWLLFISSKLTLTLFPTSALNSS